MTKAAGFDCLVQAGATVCLIKAGGPERLRVIAASVMPTIIAGNTSAPTNMIAETDADMLLRAAGSSTESITATDLGAV